MTGKFFTACKSFFFGERCSLCNHKMHRDVDEWCPSNSWEIFLEYECRQCDSYMRARNYKWINKSYKLMEDYYLHISASTPTEADIYEPMRLVGISYCVKTIPINDIYVSREVIDCVNELVKKIILLS